MEAVDLESLNALPIQEPEQPAESNERTYTYREKALRDYFVREYLVDYDAIAAAMRIGYNRGIAREYAVRLMDEPYVARQIAKMEGAPAEEDSETLKKRIMAGLIREANYKGVGSSQAARVAALGKLAQLNGMEPATKTKTELTGPNGEPLQGPGQFIIPGIMTPEAWEAAALAQQSALVSGKTEQVAQIATPNID